MYDFANSAFATTILAVIFNHYFAEVVAGGETGVPVNLLGASFYIPGASLWGFLVAVSTALVALSSPILGAISDRAGWRKRFLAVYCYVGVAATVLMSRVGPGDLLWASLLFLVANMGFSGGNVFYNAFLLDVTRREYYGWVSGLAWGVGYLGGGLCLALNLLMLSRPQWLGFAEGGFTVGDCVLAAGLWWGVFAVPTMLWVREPVAAESLPWMSLAREGWERIRRTLREIRRYRELAKFLLAYLLFNDGIETVIVMASIFGAEVVGLDPAELVVYFLMIQATALVGSLVLGALADRFGNKRMLLVTVVVWTGVVLWAFQLGWLTDLRTEFYLLGVASGLVMGGSQSIARSLQGAFTPRERAAEFFGFFAISGKFAAIFGTAIYGAAIWITGGVKPGILVLGVLFVAGGMVLAVVDEQAGIRAAQEECS